MPSYAPLALIGLLLVAFSACVMFLQTHMPAVRRARAYLNRRDFRAALKASMTGIGQVPWAWISDGKFMPFVINWLATEKELKEIAQEALNELSVPNQDSQEAFGKWLSLTSEAERVATLAVGRQLENYNEADWNSLSLELAKIKVWLFSRYFNK